MYATAWLVNERKKKLIRIKFSSEKLLFMENSLTNH